MAGPLTLSLLLLIAAVLVAVLVLFLFCRVSRTDWWMPKKLSKVVDERELVHRNFLSPDRIVKDYWPKVTTCFENFEHAIRHYPEYPCLGSRKGEKPYTWETFRQIGERRTNCKLHHSPK